MNKIFYTLPELADGQEWSCDQCGGDNIKPKLTKNIVQSLQNIATGQFISGLYEEYYACNKCGGDLSLWCNKADDFIEADAEHYKQTDCKQLNEVDFFKMEFA